MMEMCRFKDISYYRVAGQSRQGFSFKGKHSN